MDSLRECPFCGEPGFGTVHNKRKFVSCVADGCPLAHSAIPQFFAEEWDRRAVTPRQQALEAVAEAAKPLIENGGWATGRTLDQLSAALAHLASLEKK